MKICNKCQINKDFKDFTLCKANKDGYHGTCKECRYGHKPHKPILIGLKKCITCNENKDVELFSWCSNHKVNKMSSCKVCRNKIRFLKRKEDPIKESLRKRKFRLKYRYNISLEEYQLMYTNQKGKCLICEDWYDKLNVDHCHETNKVRGLLCSSCNLALGSMKDKVSNFIKAIEYLKISNTDKS